MLVSQRECMGGARLGKAWPCAVQAVGRLTAFLAVSWSNTEPSQVMHGMVAPPALRQPQESWLRYLVAALPCRRDQVP